jgi:hypothetical protein
VGPSAMMGPWRRRGVVTTPVAKGAASTSTGAFATGEGAPEWPLPPGVPGQCFPRSGEPALPPPAVTAQPEHLLVQGLEGSKPQRIPRWRGSPCPASTPLCTGGHQLQAPRWREPLACSCCPGGTRGALLLSVKLRWWRRKRKDPWHGEGVGGARVVLEEGEWSIEGVEEAAFKGAAGIKASSPSAGIGASPQCPCSEVTRHHDSLTPLRRPPFRLANRNHATCLRPLHLHMVL